MKKLRVLVAGTYHQPTSAVEQVQKAFGALAEVQYVGTPWGLECAGYARDVDIVTLDADLLVFVEEWLPFFPRGLEKASFKTAAFFSDVIYDLPRRLSMAAFFDHIFVAHKDFVPAFRARHPSVHWLPFAADPEVFQAANTRRDLDVAFVGDVYEERRPFLERLEREFAMNDFRRLYYLPEMAETYGRAKIVINKTNRREINLRVFEAIAAGAVLVTEEGPSGLEDLLTPGKEIITYKDVDHAVRVIRELLADDGWRSRVGDAGHAAFLARHTWNHRVRRILDIVQESDQKSAPARSFNESEVLVKTAEVFAHFPMMDELHHLISTSTAPRGAKIRAIGQLMVAFARATRRLGWRTLLTGR